MATINVEILADYILASYGPMSHLKLQKLLYYCEAYHLAYFDRSLINEEFEAWLHGPVIRKIFDNLKDKSLLYSDLEWYADSENYNPTQYIQNSLNTDQQDLLHEVLNELKHWNGFELESATHNEAPWLEARVGVPIGERSNNIISKETMRTYYKQELNG